MGSTLRDYDRQDPGRANPSVDLESFKQALNSYALPVHAVPKTDIDAALAKLVSAKKRQQLSTRQFAGFLSLVQHFANLADDDQYPAVAKVSEADRTPVTFPAFVDRVIREDKDGLKKTYALAAQA